MTEKSIFFNPEDFDFSEKENESLKNEDIEIPEEIKIPENIEIPEENMIPEKIEKLKEGKPESILKGALDDLVAAEDHGYMSEEQIHKFSAMLKGSAETSIIHSSHFEGPKDSAIIRFEAPGSNISCDVEVPLDISANDLVLGFNEAFHLGIDVSDIKQCYLASESPIALIKGKKLLGEFGVRDGTLIVFSR